MFDNPQPEKFRAELPIDCPQIVMYTGVLNEFQRIDLLLRSFAVALKELPNTFLLMVSPLVAEAHEKEDEALARELGIADSIIWVAPHALEDLPSYLALADLTVAPPSECPGHPVKLVNCMLAARPIVCFAGAAKGVRHMPDAYVVPNHNCEVFGQGITTLLRDRALAAELAANGHATVLRDFDWRSICRKIERIYDQLPRRFAESRLRAARNRCIARSRSSCRVRPSLRWNMFLLDKMPQRNYEPGYF